MGNQTSTATAGRPDTVVATPTTALQALRDVLAAGADLLTAKLSHTASKWAAELEQHEATRGSVEQAGYQAVKAEVAGRNPVWAAIKGAWAGASTELKVAAVLVLVLLTVLAPVPMLLLALGLLIAAIVRAMRSSRRTAEA